MKRCIAVLFSLCALTAVCAQSGTTTYNLTLTGMRTCCPSLFALFTTLVLLRRSRLSGRSVERAHCTWCAHMQAHAACRSRCTMRYTMHARCLGPAVQSVADAAHMHELIFVDLCRICSRLLSQAARSSLLSPTPVSAKLSFWSVSTRTATTSPTNWWLTASLSCWLTFISLQ